MSGAIAIFVKTPGYSAVKTRLAEGIGEQAARAWYEQAAQTVAAVARQAGERHGAEVYWAVAEDAALAHEVWWDLPNLAQGEGGLGARMGRVHAELVARHDAGLLLGADTPQLAVTHLVEALRWCDAASTRHALGPARDGGFWLYAGNRVTPLPAWESVGYSRSDTARNLRAVVGEPEAWLDLPTLTDVDRSDDLAAMERELASISTLVPAQQSLRAWLRERVR